MYPEICTIGPFTFYSYGLMLVIAFLVSLHLAQGRAKAMGESPEIILGLFISAYIFGILGSRIAYAIFHFDYYRYNLLDILKIWQGGLSWFGGLFLGVTAAIVYLKRISQPIFRTLDLIIPFLALGQSIGRIGCLLNGCCYGPAVEWGIYFPVYDKVLMPVQLFSSLALVIIFIILRFMQDRPHRQGEILVFYLILYSAWRFFIEFWRAEHELVLFGLTQFQIISAVIFFIASCSLLFLRPSKTL